jgi:hypothetical protein
LVIEFPTPEHNGPHDKISSTATNKERLQKIFDPIFKADKRFDGFTSKPFREYTDGFFCVFYDGAYSGSVLICPEEVRFSDEDMGNLMRQRLDSAFLNVEELREYRRLGFVK